MGNMTAMRWASRFELRFRISTAGLAPVTSIIAAAILCVTTACNSLNSTPSVGVPRSSPSIPANVEIVHAAPAQPHVRLGEVRVEFPCTGLESARIEATLRRQAARLGADAAVVTSDGIQVTRAMPVGGFMGGYQSQHIDPAQCRVIVATAIKYQ